MNAYAPEQSDDSSDSRFMSDAEVEFTSNLAFHLYTGWDAKQFKELVADHEGIQDELLNLVFEAIACFEPKAALHIASKMRSISRTLAAHVIETEFKKDQCKAWRGID